MAVQLKNEHPVKAVVSASAMCRLLKMSRSQFYSHIKKGTFHAPLYLPTTKRPYFTASMVEDNLKARETGVSVSGEYVIFYERQPKSENRKPKANLSSLLDGLRTLGLNSVTIDQLQTALDAIFPNGTDAQDEANVLKVVFRHLKRSGIG